MKKEIYVILYLLLFLGINLKAQDCYDLTGYEYYKSNGTTYPFKVGIRFNSAAACQKRAAQMNEKGNSVSCAACELSNSKPGQGYNNGSNTKPVTPANPNDGEKITFPGEKITFNDNSGLCTSQIGNIQRLKDAQQSLGKGDAASYSVLNSAINQMKNVECGIILKSAECKNNNCNFEWSTKESSLDEAQAQASVNRFKKALAKEEQEKAEANAAKTELVQLGVDAVFAIVDAIDQHNKAKQAKQQSSERFTKVDDDNDGKAETLVADAPDGGQNLYMDTNSDGKADKIARVDKSGKASYENIPTDKQFSMESGTSNNLTNPGLTETLTDPETFSKTWEDLYKKQTAKPGDDGYMTIVKPAGKMSEPYDFQADRKTYLINGIQNRYDEAIESSQLLSNAVREPVVQFYFKSDGLASDLGQSFTNRIGGGGSQAGDNLGMSLVYDLLADKEVTLYAHSGGAAISYRLANDISGVFRNSGLEDKLKNLTIVTVGGYSPAASEWPKGINVVPIRHENDPVPLLGGNGSVTELPDLNFHRFDSYLNEILDYNINRKKRK